MAQKTDPSVQITKIINMAITPVGVVSATTGFHATRNSPSISLPPRYTLINTNIIYVMYWFWLT